MNLKFSENQVTFFFFYSVEVAGENIRFWGAVDPICPIQNLSLFCITAQ